MKFVAWFGEVDKDDTGIVGGKGANLGDLTRAGIPVPSGFCVTSEVYFSFLDNAGIRPAIEQLLASIDVQDSARLQDARPITTTGEGDRPEENDSEARLRASVTSESSRPDIMVADG